MTTYKLFKNYVFAGAAMLSLTALLPVNAYAGDSCKPLVDLDRQNAFFKADEAFNKLREQVSYELVTATVTVDPEMRPLTNKASAEIFKFENESKTVDLNAALVFEYFGSMMASLDKPMANPGMTPEQALLRARRQVARLDAALPTGKKLTASMNESVAKTQKLIAEFQGASHSLLVHYNCLFSRAQEKKSSPNYVLLPQAITDNSNPASNKSDSPAPEDGEVVCAEAISSSAK